MKKQFVFFILFLSFSFLFPSSKSKKTPNWLIDIEGSYSSEKYVRAVGEGNSAKQSQENALANISLFFNAKIDVLTYAEKVISHMMKNDTNVFAEKSSFVQEVNVSSNAEFFCVNFEDSFYDKDKDKFYSLAYIDKKDACSIYESRINFLMESINTYKDLFLKEKDLLSKSGLLHKACVLSNLAEQYIQNVIVLEPSKAKKFDEKLLLLTSIRKEFFEVKKDISFCIKIANYDKIYDPLFSSLAQILENLGFIYSVKDSLYTILIDISCIEEVYDAGPFIRPSVEVVVLNSEGVGVYSYSKTYPRTGAKTMDKAYTRALFKIQKDFEENLFFEYR